MTFRNSLPCLSLLQTTKALLDPEIGHGRVVRTKIGEPICEIPSLINIFFNHIELNTVRHQKE